MSGGRKYHDEEWLREQYVDQEKTTTEIADECGCVTSTVSAWLKKHGIETRERGKQPPAQLTDPEWLREQYVDKERSTYDIADECECARSTVSAWLKKHSIETRRGNQPPVQLTDPERLREQYVDKEQSTIDIADQCGCVPSTVRKWLAKHGIDARSSAEIQTPAQLTDPEWLREQYVDKERSTYDIADECGCCTETVTNWLNKHGIETRTGHGNETGRGGIKLTDQRVNNPEWLREQYVEQQQTIADIAEQCGCGSTTVYNRLKKHDIKTRDAYVTGESHPNWNGGHAPYGTGWTEAKRRTVRERDNHTCQDPRCDVTQADHLEQYGQKLHVHHLRKARDVDDPEERNAKENLITLCLDCHQRWEKMADAGLVPQVRV